MYTLYKRIKNLRGLRCNVKCKINVKKIRSLSFLEIDHKNSIILEGSFGS